jgi:hypothetical protein
MVQGFSEGNFYISKAIFSISSISISDNSLISANFRSLIGRLFLAYSMALYERPNGNLTVSENV